MSIQEVRVPDLGGAEEVEVIEISVKPGDLIEPEQSLIVVESDKATVELPSPAGGTLKEIKVQVGAKVKQGDLVALLEVEDSSDGDAADPAETAKPQMTEKPEEIAKAAAPNNANRPNTPSAPSGAEQVEIIRVPDIGEAQGVTVIEVLVKPGDRVAAEESLLVLESDKATMEIPAPAAGTVREILVKVGDAVDEGTPIVRMTLEGSPEQPSSSQPEPAEVEPPKVSAPVSLSSRMPAPAETPSPRKDVSVPPQPEPDGQPDKLSGQKVHAGPAVRRLAREFGVELSMVPGSGPKHRIVKEDVQAFVKNSLKQIGSAAPSGGGFGLPTVKLPDFSQFGRIERRAMSKIHRATAENMQRSWLNVPHVTQFDEADITSLEDFRKAQKPVADQRGLKLTLMPFLLKACAYALRTYPQFNVAMDTQTWEIIQKDYVHIGMAVDTQAGLMVPVIRDVDRKSIWELAQESSDLAARARDRKLQPSDMQGGCFSISSLGNLGGTAFTPIVNTPEVAILGISQAQIKPRYEDGRFEPRLMLPLSLSYDHRAVNGADAARFASLLGRLLGDIRQLLL